MDTEPPNPSPLYEPSLMKGSPVSQRPPQENMSCVPRLGDSSPVMKNRVWVGGPLGPVLTHPSPLRRVSPRGSGWSGPADPWIQDIQVTGHACEAPSPAPQCPLHSRGKGSLKVWRGISDGGQQGDTAPVTKGPLGAPRPVQGLNRGQGQLSLALLYLEFIS